MVNQLARFAKFRQEHCRDCVVPCVFEVTNMICTWASPENPMKAFLCKPTTDGLKDLPRKVAMVRAKGTLDVAKGVS